MSPIDLRPRSATELIDASVQVMRQHYSVLVAGAAVFAVPGAVLELIVPEPLTPFASMASNLLYPFAQAMVIYLTAQFLLGRESTVGEAFQQVGRRSRSILGASIMQGLLVFVGLILLIVPGVIWFAKSFAMPAAVVLEGKRTNDSWTRSSALSSGSVPRILGTLGLGYLLFMVVFLGGGFVIGMLAAAMGFGDRTTNAILSLVLLLLMPALGVLTTMLYYDLRIRREGFDLEVMTAAAADAAAAPAAVPSLPSPTAGERVGR